MKKKLTLSIDSEIYDEIKKLPRNINVSAIVSYLLENYVNDKKIGVWLSDEERIEYIAASEHGEKLRKKIMKECNKYIPDRNDGFMRVDDLVEMNNMCYGIPSDYVIQSKKKKKKKKKAKNVK